MAYSRVIIPTDQLGTVQTELQPLAPSTSTPKTSTTVGTVNKTDSMGFSITDYKGLDSGATTLPQDPKIYVKSKEEITQALSITSFLNPAKPLTIVVKENIFVEEPLDIPEESIGVTVQGENGSSIVAVKPVPAIFRLRARSPFVVKDIKIRTDTGCGDTSTIDSILDTVNPDGLDQKIVLENLDIEETAKLFADGAIIRKAKVDNVRFKISSNNRALPSGSATNIIGSADIRDSFFSRITGQAKIVPLSGSFGTPNTSKNNSFDHFRIRGDIRTDLMVQSTLSDVSVDEPAIITVGSGDSSYATRQRNNDGTTTTTIAGSGSGGSAGVTGTGVDNRVAVWSGPAALDSDPSFTFDAGILNVPNVVLTTLTGTTIVLGRHAELGAISTPATPSAGFGRFYVKSDAKPYFLNQNGLERDLIGSGSMAFHVSSSDPHTVYQRLALKDLPLGYVGLNAFGLFNGDMINAGTVANGRLSNMADKTWKGNVSGLLAAPSDLDKTQMKKNLFDEGLIITGSMIVSGTLTGSHARIINHIELGETSIPSTPASGSIRLYTKNDQKLYYINANSHEILLTSSAGSSATGSVLGTGVDNRIAVWSGGNSLDSSANITFDGVTFTVGRTVFTDNVNLTGSFNVLGNTILNTLTASLGTVSQYFDFATASATPTAPRTGFVRIYTKSDSKFYRLASNGVETDMNGDNAVLNHVGQSDPHTQYQKTSEKAAASGYASLDGSTKVPTAQIPTITGAMIGTDTITDTNLAANSVGTSELVDTSVTSAKIGTVAVTTTKIEHAAVTSVKLATGSVATVNILDANVTVDKLATNSVGNSQIINAAVSFSKIVNDTGPVIVGRQTATPGVYSGLDMATIRTMIGVITLSGTGSIGLVRLNNNPAHVLHGDGTWGP